MPTYLYIDEETGLRVEARRSIEDRDKPFRFRRKAVPECVAIGGMTEPPGGRNFDSEVRKGIAKLEHKGKLKGNKKMLRKVWDK
jgi:hypothetical protein